MLKNKFFLDKYFINNIYYYKIIKKIFNLQSKRRQITLALFLILSIVGAFTEVVSISLLIPFVDLLMEPNRVIQFMSKFNINIKTDEKTKETLIFIITLLFILAIIISSLIKFTLGFVGHLISNNITHEMNIKLFKTLITSNPILNQKSNENVVNSSIIKMHSVTVLLQQILSICSSSIIILFIFGFILGIVNIYVPIVIFIFFLIYFFLLKIFKKILSLNSKKLSESYEQRSVILNNLYGLFKLIKVNRLENFFINKFIKEDYQIAKAQTMNSILISSPAIMVSAFTIIISALIIYYMKIHGINMIEKLSTFVALAFSVQKIVPLIQNIYGANAKFAANYFQSLSVLSLISNQKFQIASEKIPKFSISRLKYQNINFNYKKNLVINKLNLELNKGDRILISGKSGAGKTTLVNILLGILPPSNGLVKVNNTSLHKKQFHKLKFLYSYTPQDNYLFNGTFYENISLTEEDKSISYNKVLKASKDAEIYSFINKTNKKFNTIVSHVARNISGGQMQRIAIARGLFRKAEIYVFDESTNAIDKSTEKKILNNIKKYYSDKIIIFISHKKLNKSFFNKRYILKNKRLYKLNE